MSHAVHFLIVEDLPTDSELVQREVRKNFPESIFRVVDNEQAFLASLHDFHPDVILSDYALPTFDGLAALRLARELAVDTPFILVTGSINEETAVSCMKAGAWDYILKDHLRRLGPAIEGALHQRLLRAEHRRAAETLKENEERLRLALEGTKQGLYDLDLQTGEALVTAEYARMLGYEPTTFAETNAAWRERLHPDDRETVYRAFQEYLSGERDVYRVEFRQKTKDGSWIWILSLGKIVERDAGGKPLRMLGTHTDINERKKAEIELQRLNRTLRVISRCNEVLVRASDERQLLDGICRNLVETGGYPLVWVGFLSADGESIFPAAQIGDDGILCNCLRHHTLDRATPCATAQAIAAGEPVIDRQTCGGMHPHHQNDPELPDHQAIISLPLRTGATALGVLSIFSREEVAFDHEEVKLLTELADDLAYGVAALRTEAALKLRLSSVEASSNGILIIDAQRPELPIVDANPAFERMTGYTQAEAHGKNLLFFVEERTDALALEEIRAALRQKRVGFGLLNCRRKNGSLIWCELSISPVPDSAGRTSHFVCVLTDVTERQRYQEELEHQATHDALTGLANRNLLLDRLSQSMVYADRSQRIVAALLLDLDRFKVINDSLGHVVGDDLLRQAAKRLAASVRAGDTVARLGGDEFVVALAEIADIDDVGLVTKKILSSLAPPFVIDGRELHIGASIGISLYPKDGRDPGALLRCADIAMYRAKEEGGEAFRFFSPEMNLRAQETMELEGDLRKAIEEQQLLLYYQPLLDLTSGAIIGAEALLRWPHAQRGMIPPGSFIPLAEETGLILPLGEWVLNRVCSRIRTWQDAGVPPIRIAVNLSARQFQKDDLATFVHRMIWENRIDPHLLELELTESMLVRQPEIAVDAMMQLKTLGITLSLDDFGTGYSSLNYLRRFPVDNLKIDRSFITDVPGDSSATAVATSIIAIAHSLGMRSIAEGIETEEQLRFLHSSGCDEMQGFYFSKPLPEEEFLALLRSDKRLQLPQSPGVAGRKGH